MINRFFFLFSACVFFVGTLAYSNASHSFPTHTQYTPIELKPAFLVSNNSYQTASVCFLGSNCNNDGKFNKGDDYQIDTAKQCKDEGYNTTSCTLPTYLSAKCPYNDNYYAKCVTDTVRACKESGYNVTTCGTGYVVESSCPYNSSYKKCKCNPCDGYAYTYAQATAQGFVADGSCQSCSTTKYKRKNNPCSGYMTCECGGEIGASVCYTGSVQKFNKCKACCANECKLSSCPMGSICRYESCTNKYCITGCASGYSWKDNSCKKNRASCQIGWIYYNDETCSAEVISGKTALGVVVYVNPDGIGGQVMSAWPIDKNGNKSNRNVDLKWADGNYDIAALPNYTTVESAATDFNSCSNTDKILADTQTTYPAARVARLYAPTNETKGKWCLPAAGVMSSIYNNQSAVQAGISKLGGVGYPRCCTWSSSENVSDIAWGSNFHLNYGLGNRTKNYPSNYVRPVLEF